MGRKWDTNLMFIPKKIVISETVTFNGADIKSDGNEIFMEVHPKNLDQLIEGLQIAGIPKKELIILTSEEFENEKIEASQKQSNFKENT